MRSTRRVGKPSVTLDDIRHFRQLGSKAPGHPEYHWVSGVEDDDRPARPGHRDQRRHGDRAKVAGQPLQQARLRHLRLQHLCDLRRRLPDGRRRLGGRLARRSSSARRPVLDLRQQPHHHRRQHQNHLHRGRGGALPCLSVECAAGRRRQRSASGSRMRLRSSARPRAGRR